MADVFDTNKRSQIMAAVRSQGNLSTEIRLLTIFREHRITGWRRKFPLFGKPDFVFPEQRLAIFVDGCFWHGCPHHGAIPESNSDFWLEKLNRNKARDQVVNRELRRQGWRIIRLWQHEFKNTKKVTRKVQRRLTADV